MPLYISQFLANSAKFSYKQQYLKHNIWLSFFFITLEKINAILLEACQRVKIKIKKSLEYGLMDQLSEIKDNNAVL